MRDSVFFVNRSKLGKLKNFWARRGCVSGLNALRRAWLPHQRGGKIEGLPSDDKSRLQVSD
ncbi:MAG: hypothetical protein CMM01_11360 [Rhodopirellula sp.]|nr:hypothetical protein [Rhodopirellula sp.]OUX51157.1 MAG: hypothetical protein CBE43_04170 [Rhodopirellula sp. TMED283]